MTHEWIPRLNHAITGQRAVSVALGLYVTTIALDTGSINTEAEWQLFDANGHLVDQSIEITDRIGCALWKLLGSTVSDVILIGGGLPQVQIKFSTGLTFALLSNADGYEDWSIITKAIRVEGNGPEFVASP
jgi:hypothetical protein